MGLLIRVPAFVSLKATGIVTGNRAFSTHPRNKNNHADPIAFCAKDIPIKCLPYQLSMVLYMTTMVITGNGESEFDSGEGA